jgi:subtilisin family serine protease
MRKLFIVSIALALCSTSLLSRPPAAASLPARYASARGEIIVRLKEQARDFFSASHSNQASPQGNQLLDFAQVVAESAGDLREANLQEAIQPLVPSMGDSKAGEMVSRLGFDRTFVLQFDENQDLEAILSNLKANEAVEYAEPNAKIETGSVIPNDPGFAQQWGLRNLGLSVGGYPASLEADIHVTEAWEITTGSTDVLVAVTDTGVDITHPDLAPNIYTNPREIASNGIDDDNNGYVDDVHGYNVADRNNDITDITGHGTEMSGIIAAQLNNEIGISGVSQSKIIPVRFFRRTGPRDIDIEANIAGAARALIYSIAAGASIINASWSQTTLDDTEFQTLKDAVLATNDAGILLVCITGNLPYNLEVKSVYPAKFLIPNQIVVTASQYNDEIWHVPFDPSNFHPGYGIRSVDVAAPGMDIFTTAARGDCDSCSQSTDPSQWYSTIDGTSASAAYVSGVAALIKSHYPNANAIMMKRRIVESVDVREALRNFVRTSGRLNAVKALTIELQIVPPTLTKMKFKPSGKIFIVGQNLQVGATLIFGSKTIVVAKGTAEQLVTNIPVTDFPSGVPTQVKLRNPDGGESQTLTVTRK